MDSGTCVGFWVVFLDSRTCFGFWEVFCPNEPLACTQTLFNFSFLSFRNIGELSSEASVRERAWSARKKNKERL